MRCLEPMHLLELREQVKPCRTITCARRRNWSASLCGSNWPSVSCCLDTASAAATAVVRVSDARAVGRRATDDAYWLELHATTTTLQLPITLYRHHYIPLPRRSGPITTPQWRPWRAPRVLTDLLHDSSWPRFRIQWTVNSAKQVLTWSW